MLVRAISKWTVLDDPAPLRGLIGRIDSELGRLVTALEPELDRRPPDPLGAADRLQEAGETELSRLLLHLVDEVTKRMGDLVSSQLLPGRYVVRVISIGNRKSRKGDGSRYFPAKMRVLFPHGYAGSIVEDVLYSSEAARPRLKLAFDAAGIDTTTKITTEDLKGHLLAVEVEEQDYKGAKRLRPKYDGYSAPTEFERSMAEQMEIALPEDPPVVLSSASGGGEGGNKQPTAGEVLITLAMGEGAALWHDTEGSGYATMMIGEHWETHPIRSRTYHLYLAGLYFDKEGRPPPPEALRSALEILEAQAIFRGQAHEPAVRIAQGRNDSVWVDLCDAEWRAVRIDANGWMVFDDSREEGVYFVRRRGMLPLPEPKSNGSVDDLRAFVNVRSDDDWRLLVAWLLESFYPSGPYPVLVLSGEQGSAKSTVARMLRSLVDPNRAALRAEPHEVRDLMIAARNSWVVAYDNLSNLPPWLSDGLCRMATGGGYATRELYSNNEETLFDAMRPVVLTGIEETVTRGDLLDRSIVLTLPAIPEERRRTEEDLWRAYHTAAPHILGALLSAVSGSIAAFPHTRMDRLPRMADFARRSTAAEGALGWAPGSFLTTYQGTRIEAIAAALDGDIVGRTVRELAEERGPAGWTGTTQELLSLLSARVPEESRPKRGWPGSARGLAGALRRAAPHLRGVGVDLEMGWREPHTRRRLVSLKCAGATVPTVPTGPPHSQGNGDGRVTVEEIHDTTVPQPSPPSQSDGDGGTDGNGSIPAFAEPTGNQPHCPKCGLFGPQPCRFCS